MRELKKILSVIFCFMLIVGILPLTLTKAENAKVNVDGDLSDWTNLSRVTGNAVSSWGAAYDDNYLYLMYNGIAQNEWDYAYAGANFVFEVEKADNTVDKYMVVSDWNGGCSVKNGYWQDRNDAVAIIYNAAHHNTPGPYNIEIAIDKATLGDSFKVTFDGNSLSFEDISNLNTVEETIEEAQAVYTGISVDGSFADWDAITKVDVKCPSPDHPGCLSKAGAVWDGDYLYIYIRDGEGKGQGQGASLAGSHSNGKYAIVSDLGYETDYQLMIDSSIRGVEGALVSHVGSEWEIAIPRSEFPNHNQTMNLAFYLGDTIVGDIYNIQGEEAPANPFGGIVYDGSYEDWAQYPHHTIQYATAGSQESQIDAKGALYQDGNLLYGHVVTDMPAHLAEAGQEFGEAVTFTFNTTNPEQDAYQYGAYTYAWRLITVDSYGNINWYPNYRGMSPGTYEYYLVSTHGIPFGTDRNVNWSNVSNINEITDDNEHAQIYGKMIMTVGINGKDEMEFYIQTDKLADNFGCDTNDLKIAAAQFGRIGREWIYSAGTSTGTIIGVSLCGASVLVVVILAKWRKDKTCIEK